MYWERTSDVRNEAVTGAMSMNCFEEILRYLHVADNTQLDPSDKMAKIRPLLSHLNDRYLKFWPVEEELDVDESMVPYYGHHSSKQFIRGKPIRFGFKLWCLDTRLEYL
jgi:DNA excision repair protein ERCC-6